MRRNLSILLIILGFFLWFQARRYAEAQGIVPIGVTLAGLPVQGHSPQEVTDALRGLFEQPVAVYYGEERIVLRPDAVGFRVDVEAMLAAAEEQRNGWNFILGIASDALGRPLSTTDIPLRYFLDVEKLTAWLSDVGARYDHPPRPPQAIATTLSFTLGEPGLALDMEASLPDLRDTLTAAGERQVNLILMSQPPPDPSISVLGELFAARADSFPGLVSIFLIDTGREEEVGYEPDIAVAGMSTMKIPIMVDTYRYLDAPPDVETTRLLTQTISMSGNFTANLLLSLIGEGSAQRGAQVTSESMRYLGLQNTFMAAPYDTKGAVNTPRTPANSRQDVTTYPDPYMQTTAKDMALLLAMILQCSEGKGTLVAAYGDQIKQDECRAMIQLLEMNDIDVLIEKGIPPDARIAHKHGFIDDTHGDVAIIWGPQGPYVLSIFLYRPTWLEWELSDGMMQDIAQATWNFFNFREAAEGGVEQSDDG